MNSREKIDSILCPVCGSNFSDCHVDRATLDFLEERAKEGKINAALSLAKIVWENIPQLKHVAESELLDGLAKTMAKNFKQETDKILDPIKFTIETLPKIIERLPDGIRNSIQAEFDESRASFERQFKTIIEFSPKPSEFMNSIQTAFEQLNEANKSRVGELERDLSMSFKETLEKMGFPQGDQMKLLSQLIPLTLPLLQELIRCQKIPSEKGPLGELELVQELREFYPDDDVEHVGGSGDIDILAIPRFNGTIVGRKILVESKKNSSGWDRGFLQQVRRHMAVRHEKLAILAVEIMPRNAGGFLFEQCPEGTILVTDRKYFHVSYGALRAATIALQPFQNREIDFSKLFAEKKINAAIEEAGHYTEWLKRIREKSQRIVINAKGILEDSDQLDDNLKRALNEMQLRINSAVMEIQNVPIVSQSSQVSSK